MVDTLMASNSITFSSSEQESSCDESTNSTNFDREQRQDKPFYSSDEEHDVKWHAKQSGSRKRLQTQRQSLDDSSPNCVAKVSESLRRLPTRRPDPNTFNRNAIMARENRRKKKEYVEKLENEIDSYKSENKKLRKMLKQQFKMVEKLSHEKDYLRSVLANKTQIVSLINVIRNSNRQQDVATTRSLQFSAAAGLEDLTKPDYELSMGKFNESYLPDETDILSDPFTYTSDYHSGDANAAINDEHNYFRGDNNEPGVCLHVSAGHLSLEFCASCNDNAKSTWLETP